MKQTLSITRKELVSYFGSPMALIFVGVFLIVTLFTFFSVDNFFARGIADVRPLFRWIPLLLIFLIAALTMRQWSEEEHSGTLEILLTMPVKLTQLVVGKFLAVLILVAITLLLTLSLPITVGIIGNLDVGPVIGGYLAAILMASAYIAIGLYVSSRTENQLVALILTILVGGLFYLIGEPALTQFVGGDLADLLRGLGTGSRFESIERGVVDLRDLAYYGTLTFVFLALNVVSLDSKRWSSGEKTESYRRNKVFTVGLIILNLIVFNALLSRVERVRIDLTESNRYTLSPVTKDFLSTLQEPLLIRGYFSEETHPLLAPLVPQIQDVLEEYEVAANDNFELEFVDPIANPDAELEANQTYGIRPTPLQVSGRGGTSLVNAYFDILIRYGDQNVVLNLLDLVEINQLGTSTDVRLRNLEYDLTRSIQRVVYGFQSTDAVLASLEEPARMTLYVTPETLPETLANAPDLIASVASDFEDRSNGKFIFEAVNPNDPESSVDPQFLANEYQIQPISASFFSADTFYLHSVIEAGGEVQIIQPTGEMSEAEIRTTLESALKRLSSGFLQVVGVWTPPNPAQTNPFAQQQPGLQQYVTIQQALRENYEVRQVDLSTGQVPAELDALLLINPQNLTDVERYAIDQYLMRGGAVFVAAGNYQITVAPGGNIALLPVAEGLREMLADYGITVEEALVLDTQNQPFPVQSSRGTASVVELIDYPFFVDVRPNGMNQDHPIVASLPAVTMNWASPITVDEEQNANRTVTTLLESSSNSWTTTSLNAQPNFQAHPNTGFPVEGERGPRALAVTVQGSFDSYFADRDSPFETPAEDAKAAEAAGAEDAAAEEEEQPNPVETAGFLSASPDTAKLAVVGSAEFLNDNIFQLANALGPDRSLSNIQFVQNSVDWFVEDTALASLRSGGTSARLLEPMTEGAQTRWEWFNYFFALASLAAIGGIWQWRKRSEQPIELVTPDSSFTPSEQIRQGGA